MSVGGSSDGPAGPAPDAPVCTRAPWIALAGCLSLAAAMGVGRFAFTPVLPMMLGEGRLSLAAAGGLASANYLGYLVGALACMMGSHLWRRAGNRSRREGAVLRSALGATAVLTGCMAIDAPAAWAAFRFLAGVASAVAFVAATSWCLRRLGELNAADWGGVMFAGPGLGILASGLLVALAEKAGLGAAAAWCGLGALAAAWLGTVWGTVGGASKDGGRAPAAAEASAHVFGAETLGLAAAYGLAGFGYIVTATFLPAIASEALPGSPWLVWFWPIFGVGAVLGSAAAGWSPRRGRDPRVLLACGFLLQALGIVLGVWRPTPLGFAAGAFLVGLPFTAISLLTMREAGRLRPLGASGLIALLTATYGVGQILGPALVAAILPLSPSAAEGFTIALSAATAGLLLGATILLHLARTRPRPPPA